jgi:ribonuclease D
MYIHTYTHTYIHTYIHTYTHTYVYLYTHNHIYRRDETAREEDESSLYIMSNAELIRLGSNMPVNIQQLEVYIYIYIYI